MILQKLREWCTRTYARFGHELACITAFVLPLRLIFAYWVMFPLLALWLGADKEVTGEQEAAARSKIPEAFLLLVLSFAVISAVGRAPLNSLRSCATLLCFAGILFAFRSLTAHNGTKPLLYSLVAGQTLAAINSFVAAILPDIYPRFLTGKVSESGQLGITLFIALGLVVSELKAFPAIRQHTMKYAPLAALSGFLLTILSVFSSEELSQTVFLVSSILAVVTILLTVWIWIESRKTTPHAASPILLFFSLPFLTAALLSNLKRGPWAGVLAGLIVWAFLYSRRLLAGIVLVAAVIVFTFAPLRTRLLQSPEHFFISGGRSEIWQIGSELALKYPLGLGLKNSKYLQEYSTTVPSELRHFHNNFLNITAETGFLGLGIFLWWLYVVLAHAFNANHDNALARTIGCAVLSWQTAGLVEYNFGDSEVLLVALIVIGALASLPKKSPEDAHAATTSVALLFK